MILVEIFQLSRKSMADFLFSLKGVGEETPLTILQNVWASNHRKEVEDGKSLPAFIETKMPPVFEKLLRVENCIPGFSINDIVSLGNQIEFTSLSSTAVQNWVKRDVKNLIGAPQFGKKYTIEQAVILFIVEDLKAALDFDSIRKVLTLIFNNPADRSDDVINPIELYAGYASIFEKIHHEKMIGTGPSASLNSQIEQLIKEEALEITNRFKEKDENTRSMILNVLVMAALTIVSAYYQTLSKQYMTATLFLQGL